MLVYFCERLCFYVVYRIPSADAADTVGVKTERNEKSKAEGYRVAYFPVDLFEFLLAYSVFVIVL